MHFFSLSEQNNVTLRSKTPEHEEAKQKQKQRSSRPAGSCHRCCATVRWRVMGATKKASFKVGVPGMLTPEIDVCPK